MSKLSTCCTCGYQWPTGQDGSHSCTQVMAATIARLEKMPAVADRDRTCVYCGCTESHACPNGCGWVDVHAHTNTGVCSKCAVVEKFPEGIVMLRITTATGRRQRQRRLKLTHLNVTALKL